MGIRQPPGLWTRKTALSRPTVASPAQHVVQPLDPLAAVSHSEIIKHLQRLKRAEIKVQAAQGHAAVAEPLPQDYIAANRVLRE